MIDWSLAAQDARGVSGRQPSGDPAPFEAPGPPSAQAERLVSAYTGLVATAPIPPAEAVARDQWIEANLRSLGGVLDPAVERLGAKAGPFAGALGTAAGGLLAI